MVGYFQRPVLAVIIYIDIKCYIKHCAQELNVDIATEYLYSQLQVVEI